MYVWTDFTTDILSSADRSWRDQVVTYAAFIWTVEYSVSHFTTGELREHHLWTGDFQLVKKIAENGQMLQGKVP